MTGLSQRGRTVLLLAGLAALVLALYANTLDNGFVLDDTAYIRDNYLLRDLSNIPLFFDVPKDAVVEDLTPGFLRGRNVRWVTYAVDYAAGGGAPWSFHLSNIVWHLLAGIALFLLARRWVSPFAAGSAAALFLAHPVQTAAVSYISGRKDVLAALFALSALWAVHRWRETGRGAWLLAVGGFFTLAFYSKESAVVLPVLLLWSDLCLRGDRTSVGEAGRDPRRPEYLLLFALALLFAWRQFGFGLPGFLLADTPSAVEGGGSLPPGGNLSYANLMLFYLGKLLVPVRLLADYRGAFDFSLYPPARGWLWTPLFVGGAALLLAWLRRRWAPGALGIGWALIALLPVSHLVPFHYPVAEHYLYLPCAGFALAAGSALERLRERGGKAALALLFVLTAVYGAMTIARNGDWQDMETVTLDILDKAPDHPRARNTLVHLYIEKGRTADAIAQAEASLRRDPGSAITHYNLGVLFEGEGDAERAIRHYREAVRLQGTLWDAYLNLGNLLLTRGRDEEGRAVVARLLSGYGYHPLAYYILGNHHARRGEWTEALELYRRAAQLDPRGAAGYFGMGGALWRLGRLPEAKEMLRAAFDRGLDLGWAGGQEPWTTFLSDPAVRTFLKTFEEEKKQ